MIVIKEIKAKDTYFIRKTVLREGMTLSHEMNGDHDPQTLHLGLFESGELVCIGSFMKTSKEIFKGSQFQLRGMASTQESQGKGYGRMLMEAAELKLKNQGVVILWCNAREIAVGFYKKLGYQTVGDTFEVEQVGLHFLMFKKMT